GTGVDVLEIDGASNNGVEAIREIRENAKYMPSTGKHKIYIIDEVHMLTTAAFNALLKTLEEPPPHVLFIFATTEPHKIPATILSRCQRFDFRRVTLAQIQTRLGEVTASEKIQTDPAALALIARAAEGSMRDALSLLDQVIAFSGSHITAQTVRESVGLIEGQTLLEILRAVFAKKPVEALAQVEQAFSRGHDLRVLTRNLIEFLHGAILAKIGAPNSATLEVSEEEWKELTAISQTRSLEEIELIFQVLHHGLEWIARSPQPKIVLDILLIKCATAEALVYVKNSNTESNSGSKTTASVATASVATAPQISSPTIKIERDTQGCSATGEMTKPASAQEQKALPAATWEGLIEHIRKTRPLLASILEHATGMRSTEGVLTIKYHPNDLYFKEQLQSRVYQEQMNTLSKEYFGAHTRVTVETQESVVSPVARREREVKERETQARSAAQSHPMIMEAKALFGGDLSPIELIESPSEGESHVRV
ncbi:MAG: DNA polymerase III subunit gamma/tau, partial [Bdellovibrionota bacterium]